MRDFSSKYTHVITCGGIGPTHDDLTFEGVAQAFGERVVLHPELVALCKKYFGTDDLNSPKFKLANVPESTTLKYGIDQTTGEKSMYPLVVVHNVYVFPGVPSLLETAFRRLEDLFRNPSMGFCTREVYVKDDEFSISAALNEANDKFKESVTIGSYPDFHNNYYKVKLTLESSSDSDNDAVVNFLCSKLQDSSFVDYDPNPVGHASERVYQLTTGADEFSTKVKHAFDILTEAFERYSRDELCVGFNGGKDCTAVLHLAYAVACRKHPKGGAVRRLPVLYIRRGQPFPEVEQFIQQTLQRYHLDLITIDGRIRDAMSELKVIRPEIRAVIMGTRSTDPNSSLLKDFSPTDPDWPAYMRVNPLLDWTYADIWRFIRRLSLPYCSLYDRGYTSLGSLENTHPNPQLRNIDSHGIVSYRPAYELTKSDSERAGRN